MTENALRASRSIFIDHPYMKAFAFSEYKQVSKFLNSRLWDLRRCSYPYFIVIVNIYDRVILHMARNEGHEGAESLQSSLESCQLLSFFREMLLDDRCYRNLQALHNNKKKDGGPVE